VNGLPSDLREQVVRRLYADAQRLDWENLGGPQKSKQYAAWLEDEAVGERLLSFKPSEGAVRVWIKDGPMKEYSRALLGVGSYAKYIENPRCTPASVVQAALGEGWSVIDGTIEIKPIRCWAIGPDGQTAVLWGKSEDFKFLLFSALEIVASDAEASATVAIVEVPASPTPTTERELMDRIAKRCAIQLRFVNPAQPRRPSQ
jgi:hypothetical protein